MPARNIAGTLKPLGFCHFPMHFVPVDNGCSIIIRVTHYLTLRLSSHEKSPPDC